MLRNLNQSYGGRRVLGVKDVGIIASQIISETATGDNGAGLLYDEAVANSGKQLRIHITSSPSSGTFFVYENGSFDLVGAADGSYSIGYQYYLDNVLSGSDTAIVNIGVVNASASGGTGTGTGTGTGGAASTGIALTDSQKIALILQILENRQVLDASTGIYTLYDDDGISVLKTASAWEDSAGTVPYRGKGLARLDALV